MHQPQTVQSMNFSPSLISLAAQVGLVLPDLLIRLLTTGKTNYGADWSSTWRERMLTTPPPLISCYDFEWMDFESSQRTIDHWLNPEFQHGRIFLPFAQNGAGDAFCLMPIAGSMLGVAHVLHDSENSEISYNSLQDFVCVKYLETFADMSHLLESKFTEQEVIDIVRTDIRHVSEFLDRAAAEYLLSFCQRPPKYRADLDSGKKLPDNLFSLISQDELTHEFLKFPSPGLTPFPVVARWDVPQSE